MTTRVRTNCFGDTVITYEFWYGDKLAQLEIVANSSGPQRVSWLESDGEGHFEPINGEGSLKRIRDYYTALVISEIEAEEREEELAMDDWANQ